MMGIPRSPVVLVHGWKSHPGVWNTFIPHLNHHAIPVWNFSHADMRDPCLAHMARDLQEYIRAMRDEHRYQGEIDIVCHCMGTCISRYLLEVLDGSSRLERVRYLIGLGPPNNGSSIAELFLDHEYGSHVKRQLLGVFIPPGFDPESDTIVQEFRFGSSTMRRLRTAGIRRDIRYHLILTANITASPAFFPIFRGATWQYSLERGWLTTYFGDGIVPHSDSFLAGVVPEILPSIPDNLTHSPHLYSHMYLPKNPEVIARVLHYLKSQRSPPDPVLPSDK